MLMLWAIVWNLQIVMPTHMLIIEPLNVWELAQVDRLQILTPDTVSQCALKIGMVMQVFVFRIV